MKKVLLTVFTGILAYSAMAQCTPDPNYVPTSTTGAGISPLTAACVNEPYASSATIVIPPTVEFSGSQVYVCRVKVDSITNVPAHTGQISIAIAYNGASYGLQQEIILNSSIDRGCVAVSLAGGGQFTAQSTDSLYAQGQVKAAFFANCASTFAVPFSQLNPGGIPIAFTVQDCTSGIEDLDANSFGVSQNYPNPFNGETQIAYNLPESGKVNFRVMNLVGKTVKEVNMNASAGANYINVSSSDYAAGVYTYSITFNGKTITKRMIIK